MTGVLDQEISSWKTSSMLRSKWLPGQVSGTSDTARFEVTFTHGRKIRRHADQKRNGTPAVTVTQIVCEKSDTGDDFNMSIPNI